MIKPFDELLSQAEELEVIFELAGDATEEERESLSGDAETQLVSIEALLSELEMKSLLGGELDKCNAYLSINAGAGGTEACDWAAMLLRMYQRYAETNGFEFSIMDMHDGEEAGIKNVTAQITGPYAFGMLKSERGVHRLVRISPFDSSSRRHTSFTAVDIIAEVDEDIEIIIEDKDIRVDTFRATGAGGQHVNTTDSAIRITHDPTGIVVQCQAERSQHNNRARAMLMLKAKIYEYELDKQRKDQEKFYGDKGAIAWGSQIRSYVMQPYTLVKDLRTQAEVGNTNGVLDGNIDPFITAFLKKSALKKS